MAPCDDQPKSIQTLRIYTDRIVEDLKEYTDTKFIDRDNAIKTAVDAMNSRLDSMNEFRSSLKDAQATFMPRVEYNARHDQLTNQIDALAKLVYTGLGLVIAIEFVLRFFVK